MPFFTDDDRRKIVKAAKTLEKEGCHFLVGAYGASPGKTDGHPVFPGGVSFAEYSFDPDAPVINAAQTSIGGICLGRFSQVGGGSLPVSQRPTLERYLNDLQSLIDGPYPGTKLYPRHFIKKGGKTVIILGEDCGGKRHFDCISFVNYCIAKALGSNWKFEYAQYKGGVAGCKKISISEVQTGDLVFRERIDEREERATCLVSGKSADEHKSPHAGIVIRDNGGPAKVIMAQTRGAGVTTVGISTSCWLFARRLNYRRK